MHFDVPSHGRSKIPVFAASNMNPAARNQFVNIFHIFNRDASDALWQPGDYIGGFLFWVNVGILLGMIFVARAQRIMGSPNALHLNCFFFLVFICRFCLR